MAINPASLPVQLLPGQAQLAGLTQGLQAGDLLRGRVVELLAGQKAVLSLNGTNLLAELPAGNTIQRGDVLTLQVLSTDSKQIGDSPAISLKLLSNLPKNLPSQAAEGLPALPPRQAMEASLLSARLPVSNANLELAASLAAVGLPVDPPTLHAVIQITDALVAAQDPNSNRLVAPQATALNSTLNELRSALALRSTEGNAEGLIARSALPRIEQALQSLASRPLAAQALPSLQQEAQAITQALSQGRSLPPQSLNNLLQGLDLAANPSTTPTAPQAQATQAPAPVPVFNQTFSPELLAAARRENAAVLLSAPPRLEPNAAPAALAAAIPDSDPALPGPALRSLQVQFPAQDIRTLSAALNQAKLDIVQAFVQAPANHTLSGAAELSSALQLRGLNPPALDLSGLPRAVVQEAVIFLKARGVEPTRAAVEAVATQLSGDGDLAAPLTRIADTLTQLPKPLLQARPALQDALQRLADTLRALSMDASAEPSALREQIRTAADRLGLNLERSLSEGSEFSLTRSGSTTRVPPEQTLKAALEIVRDEANKALNDAPVRSQPDAVSKLQSALKDSATALASLTTAQLSARPTPAYEMLSLQLPVWAGGQVQRGELSVYWRRGASKELNDREPVNVLVNLDTRGLGPVRVLMQAFRSECRCQVLVQDKPTLSFIRNEGAGLREGFDENTPFNLSRLDFGLLAETAGQALDALVPATAPRGGGNGLDLKV